MWSNFRRLATLAQTTSAKTVYPLALTNNRPLPPTVGIIQCFRVRISCTHDANANALLLSYTNALLPSYSKNAPSVE